ncbi:MAG: nucleotide disphospho-sugar-binding domain-containing protein [Actinomycetota bacterium]
MRILFFPNYLGGGFGHIGRCLALSDVFRLQGWEITFALNGPHRNRVVDDGHKVFTLSTPKPSLSQRANTPAYVYVSDIGYQVVRDGFYNSSVVNRALNECLKIIRAVKPDILLGDGYLLTWLLGKKTSIPVVQLVKSVVHPQPSKMVWWEDIPEGLTLPDVRPVFNPVLRAMRLSQMTEAQQLLSGDLFILPSIPALDPMEPLPALTHYVGPIIRAKIGQNYLPDWFSKLKNSKPLIYVSVGGAAGQRGFEPFFNLIIDTFKDSNWQIIVSTGRKIDLSGLKKIPPHIRFVDWIPSREIISKSSLIIFHGGYTRMEILMHGVPSIVIPFHSEQEYYGRLMEMAGVSKVIHFSEGPYSRQLCYWQGGNRFIKSKAFTVHFRTNMTLKPEILKKAVMDCLVDSAMKSKVLAIKSELACYGGAKKISELIKSELGIY